VKYIKKNLVRDVSAIGDGIIHSARTSMNSKIIGPESEFFGKLCVDAMMAVEQKSASGRAYYNVASVNVLKAHGKSMRETELVDGYAINVTVASQAMPKVVENAKIALLDINLMRTRMHLGVQVLIDDPDELEKIREREKGAFLYIWMLCMAVY
jgi:T-complex protein 1 subunit alpha